MGNYYQGAYTGAEMDAGIAAANAAAPQATTYTKTEVDTALSAKVDAVSGKGLSTNDFTDADVTKLSGIAAGAEVNVQSDWTQSDTSADDFIKNKPTLATVATSGSYNDLSNKPTLGTVASRNVASAIGDTTDIPTAAQVNTALSTITPALIKLVDSGAKNLLNNTAQSGVSNGVNYTVNADGSVTVSGSVIVGQPNSYLEINEVLLDPGTYVISGCPAGGADNVFKIRVGKNPGNVYLAQDTGESATFTISESETLKIIIYIYPDAGTVNLTLKPMICTKTAWDVSQNYVPYCPSMAEMYEMILAIQNGG